MTTTLLYPIISKGMAILYWPTFFWVLHIIDKNNEVENA